MNRKGVIPVVDGADYSCVYQNVVDDQWIPVSSPLPPMVQYPAFGKRLTAEQLDKMVTRQSVPALQMN